MFYKAFIVAMVIVVMVAMAVFAVENPAVVPLDLGFVELEEVRLAVAFAVAFGAGWLFGLVCCAGVIWRMMRQRRKLRRGLRDAEAQTRSLRSLPTHHAH